MIKTLWTSAAVSAFALAAAACAQTSADTTTTASNPSASAEQTTPAASTDAELRAYLAARGEIEPITARYASMSAEERAAATSQIVEIQQRHNLTAARYDAISRAIQSDAALAARVAALQSFSDAQVQAFAAASLEIDPISRDLAAASAEERAQGAEQIRQILARHNLDGATYNAIATRAQTDQALQQRIASLRPNQSEGDSAE